LSEARRTARFSAAKVIKTPYPSKFISSHKLIDFDHYLPIFSLASGNNEGKKLENEKKNIKT